MIGIEHKGTSLGSVGIFDTRSTDFHSHESIEIIYIIEGTLDIILPDGGTALNADQFVVINHGQPHSHRSSNGVLFMSLFLDYYRLCHSIDADFVEFESLYAHITSPYVNDIVSVLREVSVEYASFEEHKNDLYLESLYYKLADILISRFRIKQNTKAYKLSQKERMSAIETYIKSNYMNPITLNELSDRLYLSVPHLSRFFKKYYGMNFSSYLNEVRLSNAVVEMNDSNKSLTRIAYDNGFPNNAAFTKAFREKFGCTPKIYMSDMSRTQATNQLNKTESNLDLKIRIRQGLSNDGPDYGEGQQQEPFQINADSLIFHKLTRSWSKMVNIGTAFDLSLHHVQRQLLQAKKELGFTHVRFWNLYSPLLHLGLDSKSKDYNFEYLDRSLDFLIQNGLHPHIEFAFKPIQVLRSKVTDFIIIQPTEITFQTPEEFHDFILSILVHYKSRYGKDELETWCLELWGDPRWLNGNTYSNYFSMFEALYMAAKHVSQGIHIGGAGLRRDNDYMPDFLKLWNKRSIHPDFISVYCYPYSQVDCVHCKLVEQVKQLKQAVISAGFESMPVYITEWNMGVSDRNVLNDSCFKGAFIIKNIIEVMDEVDFMGYWTITDFFSELSDTKLLLNGIGGLIQRNGIRKPAWHAFSFLNAAKDYLLSIDNYSLITTDNEDSYVIICHNYQSLQFKFSLKPEDEFTINDQRSLYIRNDKLSLSLKVSNVKNGDYKVRTSVVNERFGSIQGEWQNMHLATGLDEECLSYLRKRAIPSMSLSYISVNNHTITLDALLDPQEIRLIKITYQEKRE